MKQQQAYLLIKNKQTRNYRYQYVDFSSDSTIALDAADAAAPAKTEKKKEANGHASGNGHAPKDEKPKEKKVQTQFAEDHLFTRKPAAQTMFALAFEKYAQKAVRV